MTKFCTKCGKKLNDKEKCDCDVISRKENIYDADIFTKIGGFIKKPYDALINLKYLDGIEYLILIICSLTFGIQRFIFTSNLLATVFSLVSFILFPLVLSFIQKQISNVDLGYTKIFKIISISSISLIVGNLITFIFSLRFYKLAFIIFILNIILFLIFSFQGLSNQDKINKNNIGYEFVLSIFITYMIICLFI